MNKKTGLDKMLTLFTTLSSDGVRKSMVKVTLSIQINAPLQKAWEILSNLNEENLWSGANYTKEISHDGMTRQYEVTVAKENIWKEMITLYPKEGIRIQLTNGSVTIIKDISLLHKNGANFIEMILEYKLPLFFVIFNRKIKKEMYEDANNFLQSLKMAIEVGRIIR